MITRNKFLELMIKADWKIEDIENGNTVLRKSSTDRTAFASYNDGDINFQFHDTNKKFELITGNEEVDLLMAQEDVMSEELRPLRRDTLIIPDYRLCW